MVAEAVMAEAATRSSLESGPRAQLRADGVELLPGQLTIGPGIGEGAFRIGQAVREGEHARLVAGEHSVRPRLFHRLAGLLTLCAHLLASVLELGALCVEGPEDGVGLAPGDGVGGDQFVEDLRQRPSLAVLDGRHGRLPIIGLGEGDRSPRNDQHSGGERRDPFPHAGSFPVVSWHAPSISIRHVCIL